MTYLRKDRKLKNTTICTYMRAVKAFYKWAYISEYLDCDYTLNVKFPRCDADSVLPLTTAEAALIDAQFNQDEYLGLRNYCIVHLMLDCGMRSGAVTRLMKSNLLEHAIYVSNDKGNKSRYVPVPDWLLDKLQQLAAASPSDFVFMDRYKHAAITTNTIKQLFQDLKKSTGINRLHAHLLRHTFASSFVYYGGSLEFLRILLGHGSYEITQNYLHIASDMLITKWDIYKIDDCLLDLKFRK